MVWGLERSNFFARDFADQRGSIHFPGMREDCAAIRFARRGFAHDDILAYYRLLTTTVSLLDYSSLLQVDRDLGRMK
jgi:hypothetical protein